MADTIHGKNAINGNIFAINGQPVVIPAELTYTRSDLDSENSFRTVSGDLQRDRITVKRKIECQWSGLNRAEMAAILQAMDDVFFTVSFLDPHDGKSTATSMVCYVGDRTPVTARYIVENGQIEAIYESFSCSFIEK